MNQPIHLTCPRCQKLTIWQNNPYRPFCSERCRLIDLGAWAAEDYKITAEDSPFSEESGKESGKDIGRKD